MHSKLIQVFQKLVSLEKADISAIEKVFEVKSLAKGESFLEEGKISSHIAFVNSGCLRMYFVKEGEEKTFFFFIENYFATDFRGFLACKPSLFNISAVEDTKLLSVSNF